jgi:hypothetical protein
MKLFSTNAASLMLEKDRRTVTKAMLGVAPDGRERGQPRWKMSTIVGALEKHSRANEGGGNGTSPEMMEVYRRFDLAYDAMTALPTLEERRAAARKLAPMIAAMDRKSREHGRAIGAGDELTDLRADQVWRLTMRGFESVCEWSTEQVYENLDQTFVA